ncbi:MAG: sugar ABC transporter ATP-binding protein [Sphaerochaetaceae bacterium]|nr:sugar ABC transporter ATP-binding protein [Sphaerochaetaceae bacterium]MDD2405930.1 sugar ABC transporter ATP-binding protein [Sphaerochaetaceae bacterium]MDD4763862.1 sugar ABC transporter ATP-binding protein [Sphaerochaetaceae bacterium]NLO60814.1 sugar ABC transporter ATP-binding protein [Spirochaetales bacterium]
MQDYIVQMNQICKSFPGVKALENVSFDLKAGEVMALLGENGAGKSTLVKILSGVYTKDKGEITVFNELIHNMTQKIANEKGIAIIHQELNMCQHLTVAQNIFLGREPVKYGLIDNKRMNKDSRAILEKLGVSIDPETITGSLQVSKQQMVEIAKALSIDAKVLIMDEPTSALTSREIDELFNIIRNLKSSGCGIVYISHRLEELTNIADRVTIMRDGQFITSGSYKDFTMDQIIAHMVGREIKEKYPHVDCEVGEVVFEVKNINAGRMVRNVSFNIRKGELVGIAGLMGAGRTETTRAIFGADPKENGQIFLNGKEIKINNPKNAIAAGIVLAPENRKTDGLCIKLPVRENISLPNLDIISNKAGVVKLKNDYKMSEKAVQDINIKLPTVDVNAENLSGGNQQKVVVGKWLSGNSKMVMFDEPTRGIDVAAKVEIYHLMNKLKREGIGCLFVSSELPEIIGVADRIIVMCDGRITGELSRNEATQEKVLTLATRFENKISN